MPGWTILIILLLAVGAVVGADLLGAMTVTAATAVFAAFVVAVTAAVIVYASAGDDS